MKFYLIECFNIDPQAVYGIRSPFNEYVIIANFIIVDHSGESNISCNVNSILKRFLGLNAAFGHHFNCINWVLTACSLS